MIKREKPTLQDIAKVVKGASVRILEYDLRLFRNSPSCYDWNNMVLNWANSGANID